MHSTYYGSSTRVNGSFTFHLYKSLVAHIERYCLNHLSNNTLLTGVSKEVCGELEKIGIEGDRILYIPNGVDSRQFHLSHEKRLLRKKFRLQDHDIILLSVGRLTAAKQPNIMIDVFSHLERKLGDVALCIAGNGELLEVIKKLAKKKGLNNVFFLGYIDHDRDLPDLYACADYYIMTSKYEGLPLTLLEAMASGLPCIVSDIPNLEIVRDADCGIVLNYGDARRAADRIIDYISSDHPDHKQNARRYALERLDWHLISERYIKEFLDLGVDEK